MRSLKAILEAQLADRPAAPGGRSNSSPSQGDAEPPCRECGGARFVRVTTDIEHPDFGRAVPCACTQAEDVAERHARLMRYSQLGALERLTFETLLPGGRSSDPAVRGRYAAAVETARQFADEPQGWLLVSGPPGSGKTHLAAAIVNSAVERGAPALFFTVADLLDRLRGSYDADAEDGYEDVSAQIRDAPLLVLDDLDDYAATAWAREKFAQITSHRALARRPTVFTSTQGLDSCDPRLRARLEDPELAQHCDLAAAQQSPRLTTIGGVTPGDLARFTFETFRPEGHNLRGEARQILEAGFRLARTWADNPEGWLVLLGDPGAGKTHLATAAALHRAAEGDRVVFAATADLLDELRATFDASAEATFEDLFGEIRDAELLVLDDLGAQSATEWAQEKLYQLLNYRHLRRLPTIVTSDRSLGSQPPRIASRLADLQVTTLYELRVPDYRLGG